MMPRFNTRAINVAAIATIASLLLVATASAEPSATPVSGAHGRFGASAMFPSQWAGAAELGWGEFPLTVGFQAGATGAYPPGPLSWTAWMRTTPVHPNASINTGWVLGVRQEHSQALDTGTTHSTPIGAVVGWTFQRAWGRWWLRSTPNLTLAWSPPTGPLGIETSGRSFLTGPAWLEVGYEVVPHVEVSLQLTAMPLRLSWVY